MSGESGNGKRDQLEAEWRRGVTRNLENYDERIRAIELGMARLQGVGFLVRYILPATISGAVTFIVNKLLQ